MERQQTVAMRTLAIADITRSLKALLCASDHGVLLTDLQHVSLICNAKFGELFEIDPEDVVRNNVDAVREMVRRRIGNFEDWEENLRQVYRDAESEQEDELELANPRATLRRYSGPVRDESGVVIGRLWTFLDISTIARRRAMQEALREATLTFDADPARVCQLVADTVGNYYRSVTLISIRAGDFLRFHTVGGPPSAANGMPGNRMEDSYCQYCLKSLQPLIIQDARRDPQLRSLLPVKAGLTRYAGVPIYDPLGAAIGTLCILDDRSDEPLDEEDLGFLSLMSMKIAGEIERQRQIEGLRADLDVTTEELRAAQSRLVQSEKLAITGTLSASIAHDIRNILSSLSVQIDLGGHDPARALDYVRDSLGRFNVLAHRLLSYAKPKGVVFEHVDLNAVLERVATLLAPQFTVSKVDLRVAPSRTPAFVMGDEGRLEHLMVNLAVNALQASKAGGCVQLLVQFDGEHVALTVKDDGAGIPSEQLGRIFEPFVSTRADGFGLGLYSCRQIVRDHGGVLECESGPKGSTFTVRLRRVK